MIRTVSLDSSLVKYVSILLINVFFLLALIGIVDLCIGFLNPNGESTISKTREYIRLRAFKPNTSVPIHMSKMSKTPDNFIFKEEIYTRLEVDSNGFISPSFVHDNPDVTIAFLGGSTTECAVVDVHKRFPYAVGKILEAEDSELAINALNHGISGNNSMHSFNALVNKVMRFEPDIVILMHNFNDLTHLVHYGNFWNASGSHSLIVGRPDPMSSEWLIRVVKDFVKSMFPNIVSVLNSQRLDDFYDVREAEPPKLDVNTREDILASFSKSLLAFIAVSRAQDVRPVLMTQASRFSDATLTPEFVRALEIHLKAKFSDYHALYMEMNEVIRSVARQEGVTLIDLATEIPSTDEYMYDVIHFTNKGSIAVAGVIAEELASELQVLGLK
ncbi:Uncharacterised protein [BD1-7 clade bacterium]|uniref:SGNH hydrolase-type esterase domain-containing protein n=1 Tax=BD1-7 clade bacterium TaxID=2029982 RepID=A0A5S9QGK0_9GAMM|nr:Uncharacterised protein [BD1-7 clade bacterium]CAA0117805.1 Uncharacterised protein [BD1-7 clade bacterium]